MGDAKKRKTQNVIKEKQAIEFIKKGKLKEAEDIYRELITGGSKNHYVYGNLAAIFQIKQQKEEVINLLQEALKLKPDYPEAHFNLGNALREQG